MSGSPTILTAGEARRVALFAQGLSGPRPRGAPAATLRRLGGVQLDTISVLARSHELVAYARLGAISRNRVEQAYWDRRARRSSTGPTLPACCHEDQHALSTSRGSSAIATVLVSGSDRAPRARGGSVWSLFFMTAPILVGVY